MATPEELLQSMDQRRLAALLPEDRGMLDQLVASGMTKGLGIGERGVGFSGPVAGYEGPLRPEDAPSFAAGADIPVYYGSPKGIGLSPGTVQARVDAGGPFRDMMPQQKAERLSQGLQGQDSNIVKSVLDSLGIGKDPYREAFLKEAGKRAAGGGTMSKEDEKTYNRALENIGTFYNKRTGAPASADFATSSPSLKQLREDYVQLKTSDQRNDLVALRNFDNDIAAYQELITSLPLAEQEGIVNTTAAGLNLKRLRMAGNADVRTLDSIKARLISLARGFGGTSKSADSIRELERLEKAIIGDFDTKEGAQRAIDELKRFRDSKASGLPIPGLHNRYAGESSQKEKASQQGKAPQQAIDYLKAHPEAANDFKAKYGYLP